MFFVIVLLAISCIAFAADTPQPGDPVSTELTEQLQDWNQGITLHIGALIAVKRQERWCYGRFRTAVSNEVLVLTAPSTGEIVSKNSVKILPDKEAALTQKSGQ